MVTVIPNKLTMNTINRRRASWRNNITYGASQGSVLYKYTNHNLSQIAQWQRAYRISLNTGKPKLILFRPKSKNVTKNLTFRISGEKINLLKQTKYLCRYLDEHLPRTFKLIKIKGNPAEAAVYFQNLDIMLKPFVFKFLAQF